VQRRIREDDIDPRMCKALNELPIDLGIEGVEKFSMANLDTVRSKTGFMVPPFHLPPMGLLGLIFTPGPVPISVNSKS
jgi:hypothetical protein